MKSLVCYLRVSTKKQGLSGLGLDAQRAAVAAFAERTNTGVLKEFVEVESGKRSNRPELAAAIAFAKRAGAGLVVAKLDRLSRNVAFLSALMESGLDFTACDMPEANRLTLHIMAAMAEHEREMISSRTKAALAEVKKRGAALGSARPGHWDGREAARLEGLAKGRQRAAAVISEKAREEYSDLLPLIQGWRGEGKSLAEIARLLNEAGHKTRRGKEFHASQVFNILKRAK
jgi:DNA invertase Pin-like site-specific DNA recombinase